MPSIRDALAQQARDDRLSVYCSPTFCRRSKLDNEFVVEKTDDEFCWLNAFDPRRGALVRNSSSSTTIQPSAVRRITTTRQTIEPSFTKRKSMASKEAPSEQTATENLIAKKQKQRPFSLVVDSSSANLGLPQVSTNINHRSCCNLRNDAAELEPAGNSSMNGRSLLSTGIKEMENLSRSCGDLRTNPADSHRQCLLPELRRSSASQLSLNSVQISTPTDSRSGSRVSLISEGVDSYEGLYEKAYHATYVLNAADSPAVTEEKMPRDRMVRDWLSKNNPEEPKPSSVSGTAAL